MFEIKLKFGPGDTVWLMHDNRPVEVEIKKVTTSSEEEGQFQMVQTDVVFHVSLGGDIVRLPGGIFYGTKEALLQSI